MKKEEAFTVTEMKLPAGSVLRYSISAVGGGATVAVVPADQAGVGAGGGCLSLGAATVIAAGASGSSGQQPKD